ncbi:DNA polymerase epsilon subunit B [Aspergillus luchuensis]|uniref:DNA polymerase epsilon subunit B n=1 Tax=Aspergillus kawachii TaxID=1069201 RepID=A0A146FV45_ASPKA|nr:DNA polymerase epsilon subunit B [Aspergillus luchuensis]
MGRKARCTKDGTRKFADKWTTKEMKMLKYQFIQSMLPLCEVLRVEASSLVLSQSTFLLGDPSERNLD